MAAKTLITQASLESIKTEEALLVENLNAHANISLSEAHGWEFLYLTHPFYDAYGNDISIYSDSNGDKVGDETLRLTHNNVNYYIPLLASSLSGQNPTTGIQIPAATDPERQTAWTTEFSITEHANLRTVNN